MMLVGGTQVHSKQDSTVCGKTQNLLEGTRSPLALPHLITSLLEILIQSSGEIHGKKADPGFPDPSRSWWILSDFDVQGA